VADQCSNLDAASAQGSDQKAGHLQSHGLTGVQARHYDGHEYLVEKRSVLDFLSHELRTTAVTKAAVHEYRRSAISCRWPQAAS